MTADLHYNVTLTTPILATNMDVGLVNPSSVHVTLLDKIQTTTPSSYQNVVANLPKGSVFPDLSPMMDDLGVKIGACSCPVMNLLFQPDDRYDYSTLLQKSALGDLTDVRDLITFTREQAINDSVDFSNFIEECTFDRSDCSDASNWITYYNQQFGRCYTFTNAPGM
jgi:hypothetical protein